MAFEPAQIETVTFDSYSTLVDVDAAERALDDYVDDPTPVSRLWRSRSLEYAIVSNEFDAYQPFYEMNRDALEYALGVYDIDVPAEERDEILSIYHRLDVFDDVQDGMERLTEGGYDLYVVSNGNPEMLESMIDHTGIEPYIEDYVSADEVEVFKPDREIYRHAAARTGTPINNIVHITAGWFDVQGAMNAGMQGAWANRKGRPWEPFHEEPDVTVETFFDLADELGV
jgi:2-haloacid dehalogenase